MESVMGPVNILPTKSMQNVVTSIATKLTHLIISSQNKENIEIDSNYDESLYSNLVETAESTNNALRHLAEVTLENISRSYPEDNAIYNETEIATQNLVLAGEKMLLCCQILTSTVQYKTSPKQGQSNKQLVDLEENISKTFQSLVVVLLCVDNAEVRSLINLANNTLHQLNSFGNSQTMESLVENLGSFASFVHELHEKVWKRSCELVSKSNENRLKQALNSVKHSVPMLSTACSMAVKYNNHEVTESKLFAIDQVRATIQDIVSILKLCSETTQQQVGTILKCTNYINGMLCPDSRPDMDIQKLESEVQLLVQKVMGFSNSLTESFPKMSSKSKSLVRDCHKLIELVAVVTKMNSFDRVSSLSLLTTDKTHLTSVCRSLRGKMKSLTSNLTAILVQLVGHVFSITNEPLGQVLAIREKLDEKASLPLQRKLQNCEDAFQSHCEGILKVGGFALDISAEKEHFSRLQSCIFGFSNNSDQVRESWKDKSGFIGDGLKESWEESLKDLLNAVVDVLNIDELTASLEKEITSDFDKCHEAIVNLDDIELSNHVINSTGKCKLLSAIAKHCISSSPDPLYRNGLLCHVKQHNEAIAHTIASANQLVEDTANLSAQEHFLHMTSQLKTSTSDLKDAILSKSNHPKLASEGRKGLRDFSDQGVICGMIQNMHVLNKKLAALGFEPQASPLSFNKEDQTDHNISSLEKSFDENDINVDDLFGTSGRPIGIDSYNSKPNKNPTVNQSTSSKNVDKVKKETKLNPVIEQLLIVCKQNDDNEIEKALAKVNEMNFSLSQIVHDSYSDFKSSNLFIEKKSGTFNFTKDKTNISVLDFVQDVQENMSETCDLIVETINNKDFDSLGGVCETYSEQYQHLSECAVKVLDLYSITVKKFVNIKPDSVELNISSEFQKNAAKNSLLDKSSDGLLVLGRLTETLLILSSDVIALYKQEKKKTNEDKTVVVNHMNELLRSIQNLATDISTSRKKLKLPENISSTDVVWLQLHALSCSSKVSVLTSFVSNLTQTVLGIRNIKLPIIEFLNEDANIGSLFKQFNTSIVSLSGTCIDKVKRIKKKNALGLEEQTKLNKIRNRVEMTGQSLIKIIEFLLPLRSNKDVLTLHGFVVCHLMFLHQRFLLECCRIFLVTNALNSMANVEEFSENVTNSSEKHGSSHEDLNHNDKQTNAFSQRLETLKQERKERESDLFKLLSDADNFEIPIKSNETKDHESNC